MEINAFVTAVYSISTRLVRESSDLLSGLVCQHMVASPDIGLDIVFQSDYAGKMEGFMGAI